MKPEISTMKMPFEKNDIQYDTVRGEVSLKREKFDDLIRFVRELLEATRDAENARDTARSRQRRAEDLAGAYTRMVEQAIHSVKQWLHNNSIQELSRQSGIPYATCHRIVNGRLQSEEIEVATLGKILKVVQQEGARKPERTCNLLVGGRHGASWKPLAERMGRTGVDIMTASSGQEAVSKAQEHTPDVVFVDVSMPGLTADVFSDLCDQSRVMVLTGADTGKVQKLVEGICSAANE
jgi:CheY-like chemotaxis protein